MNQAQKSYEIQAQVRHNASEYKNAINDLFSWQKDIKEKEQKLKTETEHLKTLPVRTHTVEPHFKDNKLQDEHEKLVHSAAVANKKTDEKKSAHTLANEHKELGNKHVKLGHYEKAIAEYTAAIASFGKDAIFYSNRAFCYLKLNRYEECIKDCDCAIDLDKLNVKAHYRRMQANESLENYLDALNDCTAVLMIEPKNSEAKKSFDRINTRLQKQGKSTEGPNFSTLRKNYVDILPIEKPPYKRSSKPLQRAPIVDVVSSKALDPIMQITDEELDKMFNSDCGPYVEIKKEPTVDAKSRKKSLRKHAQKQVDSAEPKDLENQPITNCTPKTSASMSEVESSKPVVAAKTKKSANLAVPENVFTTKNIVLPPPPTSTAQFYTNWKELTPTQKYEYIKSIKVLHLCKMLGAGFDSETLSSVLQTLRDYYLPNKDPTTAQTLLEISKNNEVGILSLLMSTEERKVLTDIIDELKKVPVNAAVITIIQQKFNIK